MTRRVLLPLAVLVWMVGGDGVALVGNLEDFTREESVALAESVVATR